jgi:hypothetical protein
LTEITICIDDKLIMGSSDIPMMPTTLWIGNPWFTYWSDSDWLDIAINYIHTFMSPYGLDNYSLVAQWVSDVYDPSVSDNCPIQLEDRQFSSGTSIAVDKLDNVADRANNRIEKFLLNGDFVSEWGTIGTANGQFDSPAGIAVDNAGNVYVADTSNNRIQKFSGNGTFLTKWGTKGTANGQFNSPHGIAVDDSCNIYVADTLNHRIMVYSEHRDYISPGLVC